VRVPWITCRAGGQRDVTATPVAVPSILRQAWDRFTGLERPVCDPRHGPGTGLACPCEEASATSARPSAPQGGHFRLSSHTCSCDMYHSTSLRYPGAACGVAPLVDRERRVGCSMDSSCELLSSLYPASGSVHCCEVPCRTARRKQGTYRDVLLGFASLQRKPGAAHRWVVVDGEARRALL
jgi:hypothetical protein